MRDNPRVMFGLSALVMGIAVVVSTAVLLIGLPQGLQSLDPGGDTVTTQELADLLGTTLVAAALTAVIQAIALSVLNGVLISAVSDAVIGRRPTAGEVLRRVGWAGVGRLLLLSLLSGLAVVGAIAVIAVPVALLYQVSLGVGIAATVIGVPAAIALAVFVWVRVAFAAPAMLLEKLGVTGALRRSWRLGRGSWWRALGILLLSTVIGWVTSSVLQVPFSVIGGLVGAALGAAPGTGATGSVLVETTIANLGTVLSTAVVAPFTAAVVSLLYIDLRIRREGLDVALARAAQANSRSDDPDRIR
jgi:hypothetical protein